MHFSIRLQIIPDAALRPDDGLRADLAQPTTSPQTQSSSDDQMMPDGGIGGIPGGDMGGAPGGRIRTITVQAK